MTLAASLAPHLPVMVGLAAGTLAKYGLELEDGRAIVGTKVLGHCMMLALLGLLAEASCDMAAGVVPGFPPTARAIAGAGAGILSAQLVRRFRKRADREARARLDEER